MDDWTVMDVQARLVEAVETAHRLPPARVQGYVNVWQALLRAAPEREAADGGRYHVPPTPLAVDRMLETMRWMQWLDQESRHIVWMRADQYEWSQIAKRFGCSARTAQRKRDAALSIVANHLNRVSEVTAS